MTVTLDEIKAYPPDTGRALRLATALVLCVVPAAAFGQVSVNCPDDQCTHVVSVYKGEGGLIAEADGADMVTFLSSCDGVHISGELTPNDDGVVSMLFDTDNGLACDADDGSFELGPVKDGGWFWITDDRNSAVGVLVDMDVLDNPTTEPTDAGMSVETTAGKGAVLLKEASTGRIGILQTILPEMETAQATTRKCGYSGTGTAGDPFKRVASECALGDGGTIVVLRSTDPITGNTVRIMDGDSVTRPRGSGAVQIVARLFGNGSGHFRRARGDEDNVPVYTGHLSALDLPGAELSPGVLGASYEVRLSHGGPGPGTSISADGDGTGAAGGVSWSLLSDAINTATISIEAHSSWCSETSNHSATVVVTAYVSLPLFRNFLVPPVKVDGSGKAASTTFRIVCP